MIQPPPSFWKAIKRGFRRKCPSCGKTSAFKGYLKVKETCPNCNAKLAHLRADDLPPYLTILLVGHIVVPLLLHIEKTSPQPMTEIIPFALILTGFLTLLLLPVIKGGVLALMWRLDKDGSLYN